MGEVRSWFISHVNFPTVTEVRIVGPRTDGEVQVIAKQDLQPYVDEMIQGYKRASPDKLHQAFGRFLKAWETKR